MEGEDEAVVPGNAFQVSVDGDVGGTPVRLPVGAYQRGAVTE